MESKDSMIKEFSAIDVVAGDMIVVSCSTYRCLMGVGA